MKHFEDQEKISMDDPRWNNSEPGIDTPFAFNELMRRAVLSGELAGMIDSDGIIFVAPRDVFEFAMKQEGFKMESSVRAAWVEALKENLHSLKTQRN